MRLNDHESTFFSKRIKSKLILESNGFKVEMGGGVVYLIRNFNNKRFYFLQMIYTYPEKLEQFKLLTNPH